ncbi:hypothetical protein [Rubripirellula tenax]|nr:hypothetical protein [Rubripirellula tenax]
MKPIDSIRQHRGAALLFALLTFPSSALADGTALADSIPITAAIAMIQSVSPDAAGMKAASEAAAALRVLPADRLPQLFDAMSNADAVSRNWIRGIVFDITRQSPSLPKELIESYAMDRANNGSGRGLAMEILQKIAPEQSSKLIMGCLDDPSLPLRQMAVAQTLGRAEAAKKDGDDDMAKKLYRDALIAARQPRQLEAAVRSLKDLGETASIRQAFSMITTWKAIGPFNNTGGVGFDAVYSPESTYLASQSTDAKPAADGKDGDVMWKDVEGDADTGKVDLATAFEKEKGATAYLFTTFRSPTAQVAQARLGCVTANKVWVNGQEQMANEVYHSGTALDQYIANVELREGDNTILIKACQNEQTEGWAQDWEFQFRLTDLNGKGLTSGN